MGFDLTFLGSSGGPIDGTNCAIMIKPSHVTYSDLLDTSSKNEVFFVDAGSGLTALAEVVRSERTNEQPVSKLLSLYDCKSSLDEYVNVDVVKLFGALSREKSPIRLATDIFDLAPSYLITHAHLDHIAALTINSAGLNEQSSKHVFGSYETIVALQKHIFNGVIWPNLAEYNILKLQAIEYRSPFLMNDGKYEVVIFELSHGSCHTNMMKKSFMFNTDERASNYLSSAFLVRHRTTKESVLVFGDFESDSVSKLNRNNVIWSSIAPMLVDPDRPLKAIVLECSMKNSVKEDELYGHLSPSYLIDEMKSLHSACINANSSIQNPLQDLNIIITHVKEPMENIEEPRRQVLGELNEMNNLEKLGLKFSIAFSGITLSL